MENMRRLRPLQAHLSDIVLYDAVSTKTMLPASHRQVLVQGLPTMEGVSKEVINDHKNCISIYHLSDIMLDGHIQLRIGDHPHTL